MKRQATKRSRTLSGDNTLDWLHEVIEPQFPHTIARCDKPRTELLLKQARSRNSILSLSSVAL